MRVNRRDLMKAMGAGASAAAIQSGKLSAADSTSSPPRKPNIVLFVTDDHGQWLQEAYGNSEVHTPNLMKLARRGVRMSNSFTTCPVCSPARASILTGRMPSQHGIHDWIGETTETYQYQWLQGQVLLSELLKDAGYHTGLVGKWHCGQDRYPRPGFDYWFTFWETQYPHSGKQVFSDNGKQLTVDGFQSSFFTDRAISFLRSTRDSSADSKKPFFLYVGYTDTHSPHTQMPAELLDRYKDATFRDIPAESFAPCHGASTLLVSKDPAVERARRQQYYAAASSVDREVGRIVDELAALGELDNTLVIYAGDHGLNGGHHGLWEKGNATIPQNFLEESIRVSAIFSWPSGGISRGLECDISVNHCDLFATLLDVAGAAPNTETARRIHSPGQSYLSHLRGEPGGEWRDSVICEYGNARMIRHNGYKLILRYPYNGRTWGNEFYDLRADPRETVNLYPKPSEAQATIIAELRRRIDDYFAVYSIPEHDGLHMETQPIPNPAAPWLK